MKIQALNSVNYLKKNQNNISKSNLNTNSSNEFVFSKDSVKALKSLAFTSTKYVGEYGQERINKEGYAATLDSISITNTSKRHIINANNVLANSNKLLQDINDILVAAKYNDYRDEHDIFGHVVRKFNYYPFLGERSILGITDSYPNGCIKRKVNFTEGKVSSVEEHSEDGTKLLKYSYGGGKLKSFSVHSKPLTEGEFLYKYDFSNNRISKYTENCAKFDQDRLVVGKSFEYDEKGAVSSYQENYTIDLNDKICRNSGKKVKFGDDEVVYIKGWHEKTTDKSIVMGQSFVLKKRAVQEFSEGGILFPNQDEIRDAKYVYNNGVLVSYDGGFTIRGGKKYDCPNVYIPSGIPSEILCAIQEVDNANSVKI